MLMLLHLVAGTRPNFVKIAPLFHTLKMEKGWTLRVIHTGQHYDPEMSSHFYRDLNLPAPDYDLNVGDGTHIEQIAKIMLGYEKVCAQEHPSLVIVVGDVNSTLACALSAKKFGFKVAHLEAGLRNHDSSMPEELNRVLTDRIADILWTPSQDADTNLLSEGIPSSRVFRVGNIMIDTFEMLREKIRQEPLAADISKTVPNFVVVTFHRPSNVDHKKNLSAIVENLIRLSQIIPVVFPVHPRTKKSLGHFGLWESLSHAKNMILLPAMSYTSFMGLVSRAHFVITDSGGIQEESTYLGIPCLTLRDTTERPITVILGTNRLVNISELYDAALSIQNGNRKKGCCPELWDGRTSLRIRDQLRQLAI